MGGKPVSTFQQVPGARFFDVCSLGLSGMHGPFTLLCPCVQEPGTTYVDVKTWACPALGHLMLPGSDLKLNQQVW